MNILEKKALIQKVFYVKNFISAKEIFMVLMQLYPESGKEFISPSEIGQLLRQIPDMGVYQKYPTSPKLYYI